MKITKKQLRKLVEETIQEMGNDSQLESLKRSFKHDLSYLSTHINDLIDLKKELDGRANNDDGLYDPFQGVLLDLEDAIKNLSKKVQDINALRDSRKHFFGEADVVDFNAFKKKREAEDLNTEFVVTDSGEMVYLTSDLNYVVINNEEQRYALLDGDLEKAKELGAEIFTIEPGRKK